MLVILPAQELISLIGHIAMVSLDWENENSLKEQLFFFFLIHSLSCFVDKSFYLFISFNALSSVFLLDFPYARHFYLDFMYCIYKYIFFIEQQTKSLFGIPFAFCSGTWGTCPLCPLLVSALSVRKYCKHDKNRIIEALVFGIFLYLEVL